MNSSVINSSQPFNHPSSGYSPQLSDTFIPCIYHYAGFVCLFIERSTNLVVGYPANIMVMWLVAREKSDSSTSNHFIFSLALADAWLCVMSPISCFGFIILHNGYFNYIIYFYDWDQKQLPTLSLLHLPGPRVAVVHPIVFTSIKDKKIRVAISMLVWGLVIAYALCRSLYTPFSSIQHYMYSGLILASFTIMVYCNVSIIWSLRKSVLGKEKINPMKKKALRTVQIYLGIIVFHYLPTVFTTLLRDYLYFPETCTIETFISSLMVCSSITQPLLYISQIKQLPWLKKLLCICCRSPSPEPQEVST